MIKLLLLITFSLSSYSSTLSEEDVLGTTKKFYPKVLETIQNVEAAKEEVYKSLGVFDAKLKSKLDMRTRGFYDGKSVDTVIEKPLPYFGSRVYGGYKVSDGDYPEYEEKADTLDNGETRFGVGLSLLRNRDIDQGRMELMMSRLRQLNSELSLNLTKLQVQNKARKIYWKWVAKGNIYFVYKELLQIALNRQKALRERVKRGDLARIYETENDLYLVNRRSKLVEAEIELIDSALELSLYYRDQNGDPVVPEYSQIPKKFPRGRPITRGQLNELKEVIPSIDPRIARIENKKEIYNLEEKIGENDLLPMVDINFEVSRDRGIGSETLRGTENRGMINIEIPIERKKAKGQIRKARFMKNALEYRKKLYIDQLIRDLVSVFNQVNLSIENVVNTEKEINLSKALVRAEREKFTNGASDFFVLNLREQALANAKISNIKALFEYKKARADFIIFDSMR